MGEISSAIRRFRADVVLCNTLNKQCDVCRVEPYRVQYRYSHSTGCRKRGVAVRVSHDPLDLWYICIVQPDRSSSSSSGVNQGQGTLDYSSLLRYVAVDPY